MVVEVDDLALPPHPWARVWPGPAPSAPAGAPRLDWGLPLSSGERHWPSAWHPGPTTAPSPSVVGKSPLLPTSSTAASEGLDPSPPCRGQIQTRGCCVWGRRPEGEPGAGPVGRGPGLAALDTQLPGKVRACFLRVGKEWAKRLRRGVRPGCAFNAVWTLGRSHHSLGPQPHHP
uniref:Uncharacterized protein n=1 Tax=Molossus molossus TaxID=27622 RepID=A0A7J8G0S3_MOLMO|nr:hypothetical protein HJG59_008274 [Molossus molossus]